MREFKSLARGVVERPPSTGKTLCYITSSQEVAHAFLIGGAMTQRIAKRSERRLTSEEKARVEEVRRLVLVVIHKFGEGG
jgi:hypothetical protein